MKLMWVCTEIVGSAAKVFGEIGNQSGGWIEAYEKTIQPYIFSGNIELHYVITSKRNESTCSSDTGIYYHLIDVKRIQGINNHGKYLKQWKDIVELIKPDIIQVWGTELPVGLDVEEAAKDIPIVFFIQGVISAIHEHSLGGLKPKELMHGYNYFTLAKILKMLFHENRLKKQVLIEKTMIKNSAGIIVDNNWTAAQFEDCDVKDYYVPLAIDSCFVPNTWKYSECEKQSIFSVYGKSPIKGLHILINALPDVLNVYPETKLYIPGNMVSKSFKNKLFTPIYISYLNYLIKKNKLENCVVFQGRLSHEQMYETMKHTNVFVLPSCIENHSSTLRESMIVGCPCISSDVGSTIEFINHGENGFLYRFNESKTLAYYIKKVFSDGNKAEQMGEAASKTIQSKFPQNCIGKSLIDVYNAVLAEWKQL